MEEDEASMKGYFSLLCSARSAHDIEPDTLDAARVV